MKSLSKEAVQWCHDWLWSKSKDRVSHSELTPQIRKELAQFKSTAPIDLYRFVELDDVVNEPKKKLRSYFSEKSAIEDWVMSQDPPRAYIEVWIDCPSDKVVVDFRKIPKQYHKDMGLDDNDWDEVLVEGWR